MNNPDRVVLTTPDHSNKSILARGCDPHISQRFSQMVPPLIGNPEYVPTTNDADFIEKLKSRKWSVVFFAPGACRFSAAQYPIPGGNEDTRGWTLTEYRELVNGLQGDEVQIVETLEERQTIGMLKNALDNARDAR